MDVPKLIEDLTLENKTIFIAGGYSIYKYFLDNWFAINSIIVYNPLTMKRLVYYFKDFDHSFPDIELMKIISIIIIQIIYSSVKNHENFLHFISNFHSIYIHLTR